VRFVLVALVLFACRGGEQEQRLKQATGDGQQATDDRRQTPAAPPDAAPGKPEDLVDIAVIDPSIAIEMRYASENNFTKVVVYPVARCLLRRDAAERLARVQAALRAAGLGLEVWDCYRPFSVQKKFWKLVPDDRYVAQPVEDGAGRPLKGSKHNRGAAVDLTLVDRDGKPLEMPTDHDDFSERAHRGNRSASPAARANSARLEKAMTAEGFEPLPTEWWHFDAPGWERYPLSDQPLSD
jgi:beta-N-acetylhexosaminidase/D-alanyl-D-alanine dipeptidase